MEYNLTREQAAKILWISTRTLDRWIRKWVFTYEKRWNKIFLAEEEVKNYSSSNQINNIVYDTTSTTISKEPKKNTQIINSEELITKISKHFDENMKQFLEIIKEKDKKIEEKNQVIFALQNKVAELETKLKNTVALPLYQNEKKELILEKENLKIENQLLEENLKKEKIKNIALISILVLIILIVILSLSR